MEAAGLWMLLAAAIVLLGSGLPAYAVLMGVSVVFGLAGVALGGLEFGLLTALPSRIIGLLENDLLQALPLYVLMGALLNRLPLAERLFRCGVRLGGRSSAAPSLATLGLGALLAPMNGSVGASVAMLSRSVAPRLIERGVPAAESTALVCVASTLGVVIPPSLVLILLGDAMMRAHTEATNVTKAMVRIVNTQDIFRGALFALFVAATTFTLVFRAFGTDRLLDAWVSLVPGGATGAAIAVLVVFALSAFVLDAFEIVFVIVPIVMPPVLTRAPDAVWISVLALLALQASFLVPPAGYAVMMARGAMVVKAETRALTRALAPYLAAQLAVLALVVCLPSLAHLAEPAAPAGPPVEKLDDAGARQRFNDMLKLPPPPEE